MFFYMISLIERSAASRIGRACPQMLVIMCRTTGISCNEKKDVDHMCGLFDRFRKKGGRSGVEERVAAEIVEEENTWESSSDEIGYKGSMAYESEKGLIFHVRLTNLTDTPWGKLKLGIGLSKDGVLRPTERILRRDMLDPHSSEIFKFYLEPALRAGETEIAPYLSYFDFNRKENAEVLFPVTKARMRLPKLTRTRFKMEEIFDTDWRVVVSSMESFETESDIIEKKPPVVFLDLKDAIRSLGIHAFKPEVNPNLYRGLCRFWAEDASDRKYGIHLEVIGKEEKTKALLIFYSSDHMTLIPFATGVVSYIRRKTEYKRDF